MRFIFVLLFFTGYNSFAQNTIDIPYPKGYFRNPLDIPPGLAGNFGELRPNHYHMGLDFKTNHLENLAVLAAADGYIARIKVEPFGFGRAIYINHPNGFTTVYGHLNSFYPALEQYVKEQQYRLESWAVFLDVPAGLFAVKKGDFIANSGNTGGSQGPHLHFEVRTTADDINCNPWLFAFPIADNVPPTIQRLAIYDRTKSTYEQSPKIIPVKKTLTGYITNPAVIKVNTSKVSLAVTSYDTQTGSANLNGIYEGILFDNNVEQIRFIMDKISYDETRYLNAHIDYKTKATGGPYLQHLSELPGYNRSIYHAGKGDGIIDLSNQQVHDIRIETKDANGNTAILQSKIQYEPASTIKTIAFTDKMFYPLMLNVGDGSEDGEFYISEKGLYDSVHITYKKTLSANPLVISAVHSIGASYIPLQEGLVVRIKPTAVITPDKLNSVIMQRFTGTKKEVEKVEWQNGWAMAKFREFGNFQLLLDEVPPEITAGFKNGMDMSKSTKLIINAKDNFGAIRNFRATLDGKWLRFSNDKQRGFIYMFDEHCLPGEHILTISVQDEAGNNAEKTFTFKR